MTKPQLGTLAAIALAACACGKTSGQAPTRKDGMGAEQASNNLAVSPATVTATATALGGAPQLPRATFNLQKQVDLKGPTQSSSAGQAAAGLRATVKGPSGASGPAGASSAGAF